MNTATRQEITSYTPGPWFAACQNDALYVIAGEAPSSNNDYPRHDADRTLIAATYGHEANSRLIAAAPDLFEVLKVAQARLALIDDNSMVAVALRLAIGDALSKVPA